jgi:hypothetical protein
MSIILRIDDCGWVPPHKTPDYGLGYFRDYRAALGLQGMPVYYGFIPTTLRDEEINELRLLLTGDERVAIHGHDHADGAEVTAEQMAYDLGRFESHGFRNINSYIPPFNKYRYSTQVAWLAAVRAGFGCGENAYFFGGIESHGHHDLGDVPTDSLAGEVHLPAEALLYGRVEKLLDPVFRYLESPLPVVLTLHATWDHMRFGDLNRLGSIIKKWLVPVEHTSPWLSSVRSCEASSQGAHQLAYDHSTGRLHRERPERRWIGRKTLDFGCRHSRLTKMLGLLGAAAECCDRDADAVRMQNEMLERAGRCWQWDGVAKPTTASECYDLITANWSIQHNYPDDIRAISKNLGGLLCAGGQLRVVSSFTGGTSFYQANRADPQWVLNCDDVKRMIVEPSGLRLVGDFKHFYYEHGVDGYRPSEPAIANAIAYILVKDAD